MTSTTFLLFSALAFAFGDATPASKGNKIAKGEAYKAVCFETLAACDGFKAKLDRLMSAEGGFSKDGSTLVAAGACSEPLESDIGSGCEEAEAIFKVRFTSTQKIK